MKLIPEKFLCRYSLLTGSNVVGIVMCLIMVGSCAAAVVQVLQIKTCESCSGFAIRNAYALSVMACVYCFIMLAVNIWFLWGVRVRRTTVIFGWLVVTALWLAQSAALLVVMLCLLSEDTSFVALLCAGVFCVIAIVILLYGLTVVFAYWKELRQLKAPRVSVPVSA